METSTLTTLVELLLPSAPDLHLDALALEPEHPRITLTVSPRQPSVSCPLCAQLTSRIHSRYRRCLADVPWADVAIRLALHVRRFFCLNPACTRAIFTERLPALVAPWARRTQRLVRHHQAVALALGGTAGARTAADVDSTFPLDILATYLAGGHIALVHWWLEQRRPHTPETLARTFHRLQCAAIRDAFGLRNDAELAKRIEDAA